jgi:AbiJ N-terminal domain 5/Abortive infection C-terminus
MDWPDAPQERAKLFLALQKAIISCFGESDWRELGYETGTADFISGHPRLLRSLSWGDADYGGCIFDALEELSKRNTSSLEILLSKDQIRRHLQAHAPQIYSIYVDSTASVPDFTPRALSPKESVLGALEDAQVLIRSGGPARAVNRVHTALHGYLIHACRASGLTASRDAGVLELYKALREHHPRLADLGTRSEEINKILRSFGAILDALTPLRNRASLAHPNQSLADDEAMLAINAVRTFLHYLDAKLYG